MNIVVCVKPVPDPRQAGSGRLLDGTTKRVNREGVELVPNRNDRVALEAALQLRDEAGGGTVTAVLMGPPSAEGAARQCLAVGADRAFLVSDRALAGSDALATARALAAAVRHVAEVAGAVGLVLTGVESSDAGTGQVGPTLAALLDLDCLPGAVGLRLVARRLEAELPAGDGTGGLAAVEAALPVLVTVSRTACEPRATTMMGVVMARSRPLAVLDRAALGLEPSAIGERGSPTRVARLLPYRAGKRAEMLAGDPAEQARALLRLLGEKGFLPGGGARG